MFGFITGLSWKVWCGVAVSLLVLWGQAQYRLNSAHTQIAEHDLALEKQKRTAEKLLGDETAKVVAQETELKTLRAAQEKVDEANKAKSNTATTQLASDTAATGGRLRDPNAVAGCRGGGSSPKGAATARADSSGADAAETGGLLSEQLTELLKGKLAEADAINDAYAGCRADIYTIRAKVNAQ